MLPGWGGKVLAGWAQGGSGTEHGPWKNATPQITKKAKKKRSFDLMHSGVCGRYKNFKKNTLFAILAENHNDKMKIDKIFALKQIQSRSFRNQNHSSRNTNVVRKNPPPKRVGKPEKKSRILP